MNPNNLDDYYRASLNIFKLTSDEYICNTTLHPLKNYPILISKANKDCQWTVAGNIAIILVSVAALAISIEALMKLIKRLFNQFLSKTKGK